MPIGPDQRAMLRVEFSNGDGPRVGFGGLPEIAETPLGVRRAEPPDQGCCLARRGARVLDPPGLDMLRREVAQPTGAVSGMGGVEHRHSTLQVGLSLAELPDRVVHPPPRPRHTFEVVDDRVINPLTQHRRRYPAWIEKPLVRDASQCQPGQGEKLSAFHDVSIHDGRQTIHHTGRVPHLIKAVVGRHELKRRRVRPAQRLQRHRVTEPFVQDVAHQ